MRIAGDNDQSLTRIETNISSECADGWFFHGIGNARGDMNPKLCAWFTSRLLAKCCCRFCQKREASLAMNAPVWADTVWADAGADPAATLDVSGHCCSCLLASDTLMALILASACVPKCARRLHARAKHLPHCVQVWGFFPAAFPTNLNSQMSNCGQILAYSSSNNTNNNYIPVCKKRWFRRFVCLLKPRWQTWHWNGQLPLCTYMCDFKSPGVGNDLEHRAHLCGFSWIGFLINYHFRVCLINYNCNQWKKIDDMQVKQIFHDQKRSSKDTTFHEPGKAKHEKSISFSTT